MTTNNPMKSLQTLFKQFCDQQGKQAGDGINPFSQNYAFRKDFINYLEQQYEQSIYQQLYEQQLAENKTLKQQNAQLKFELDKLKKQQGGSKTVNNAFSNPPKQHVQNTTQQEINKSRSTSQSFGQISQNSSRAQSQSITKSTKSQQKQQQKDKVHEEPVQVEQQLQQCNSCKEIKQNVFTLKCGHHICQTCKETYEKNNMDICPVCYQKMEIVQ